MAWTEDRGDGVFTGKYRDPFGRKRSAGTIKGKKAALAMAHAEEDKMRRGVWLDPDAGNMTLSTYFEDHWIKNRVLSTTTRERYWSTYRVTLKPKFGHLPVVRITAPVVQTWITEMIEAGVHASTIHKRFQVLRTMLAARKGSCALGEGLIDRDPCLRISLPPVAPRVVQIYTPAEVNQLITKLDEWWRLMIWYDAETGLRWGELAGMQVGDVDFLRRRHVVQRTIVETNKAKTLTGTRFERKEYPKGRGFRVVGLSQETVDMLSRHVAERELGPDDLMFAAPTIQGRRGKIIPRAVRTEIWPGGLPISRSYFRNVWVRAIKEAELPHRRIHDLRASFISWLLDDPEMTPQKAMDIVDHAQWSTTKRYKANLDDVQEAAVSAIARARQLYG